MRCSRGGRTDDTGVFACVMIHHMNVHDVSDIPEHLFLLANEHITLNTVDSYNALADECHRFDLEPDDVLSVVIRSWIVEH